MKIVNPTDSTHMVKLIPRTYTYDNITLNLYNESTRESADIILVYGVGFDILTGFLVITFDYDFTDGDKYQIKLTSTDVDYRGKLFATTQETQEYSQTKELYYYE